MKPLRIRFNIEDFSKEEDFYRIDLSEYNVDSIISVLIYGKRVGFYYEKSKKELSISRQFIIDTYIDKSIYIDCYSVMENRNIQLEKLGI